MAQNSAVERALRAFDSGTKLGSYEENVVCDALTYVAEQAMEEEGNTAFVVATLVQAGRINDALHFLAKEAANTNSTEVTQALVLLARSLSQENGGQRKFSPRRPDRSGSRVNGPNRNENRRGSDDRRQTTSPHAAQPNGTDQRSMPPHTTPSVEDRRTDPQDERPPQRFSSTMDGQNGQPHQQPMPSQDDNRAYESPRTTWRPVPPVETPARPDVPTYGMQYPNTPPLNTYDQPSAYDTPPQDNDRGRHEAPPQEPLPAYQQQPVPPRRPLTDDTDVTFGEDGPAEALPRRPKRQRDA